MYEGGVGRFQWDVILWGREKREGEREREGGEGVYGARCEESGHGTY